MGQEGVTFLTTLPALLSMTKSAEKAVGLPAIAMASGMRKHACSPQNPLNFINCRIGASPSELYSQQNLRNKRKEILKMGGVFSQMLQDGLRQWQLQDKARESPAAGLEGASRET